MIRTPTATTSIDDEARRRRGRRQLLILAAIFFVPLAVAFWLYYGPGEWRPAATIDWASIWLPSTTPRWRLAALSRVTLT